MRLLSIYSRLRYFFYTRTGASPAIAPPRVNSICELCARSNNSSCILLTKSSEMANTSKCPINSYASFIACCSPMRVAASTATATLAATRCISIPAQLWAAFVTPPIGPQRLRRTSPALSPFILYFMALHTTMHGASSMQSSAAARPPNRDTTTNFP